MPLWDWVKNKKSGIWQPDTNDNFNAKDLKNIKAFFEDDLKKALADFKRWDDFTRLHPNLRQSERGFKGMLDVCRRAIFESKENLRIVEEIILLNTKTSK